MPCISRSERDIVMRRLLPFLLLAGCAPVSSEGVYKTRVELTIPSQKSPHDFAMCAAGALPDAQSPLNEGNHYWIDRKYGGATFERWDFLPTASGSIAERRSGQVVASYGTNRVRTCA